MNNSKLFCIEDYEDELYYINLNSISIIRPVAHLEIGKANTVITNGNAYVFVKETITELQVLLKEQGFNISFGEYKPIEQLKEKI